MAGYNSEMTRRLYQSAATLPDAERRADRGAFWGSLLGTLAHVLWGDHNWMARFANWPKPPGALRDSSRFYDDFESLRAARDDTDARIETWAATIGQAWLNQPYTWFSAAANREMTSLRGFLVMHFFNHQTHHRGQVHALLTAASVKTGETDLPLVLPGVIE